MSNTYYIHRFINMSADTFMRLYPGLMMRLNNDIIMSELNDIRIELHELDEAIDEAENIYDDKCLTQWIHDTEFKTKDIQKEYNDYCERLMRLHNNENASAITINMNNVELNALKIINLSKDCNHILDIEEKRDKFNSYTNKINDIVSIDIYPRQSNELSRDNYHEDFLIRLDLFNNFEYIKSINRKDLDELYNEQTELENKVEAYKASLLSYSDNKLIEAYFNHKFVHTEHNIIENGNTNGEYICVICSEELSDMYSTWARYFNIPVREINRADYYIASILTRTNIESNTLSSQLTDSLSHKCIKDLILIRIRYDNINKVYSFVNIPSE